MLFGYLKPKQYLFAKPCAGTGDPVHEGVRRNVSHIASERFVSFGGMCVQ